MDHIFFFTFLSFCQSGASCSTKTLWQIVYYKTTTYGRMKCTKLFGKVSWVMSRLCWPKPQNFVEQVSGCEEVLDNFNMLWVVETISFLHLIQLHKNLERQDVFVGLSCLGMFLASFGLSNSIVCTLGMCASLCFVDLVAFITIFIN